MVAEEDSQPRGREFESERPLLIHHLDQNTFFYLTEVRPRTVTFTVGIPLTRSVDFVDGL